MPRVLVVEDSPTQAQQLALILEDAGFEVEIAPDAERGFARLAHDRFDLVLSDLLLPGDSGFDLCRRIKADPHLRGIPVVVCTSQADPFNVLRGLQAGAGGFITKNRDPEFGKILFDEVGAVGPSVGGLEGAVRYLLRNSKFLPAIASYLVALARGRIA